MFDTRLRLNLHIAGLNQTLPVTVLAMYVLINAQPISVSDKSMRVGQNCIDTPKLWLGDISEAPNR